VDQQELAQQLLAQTREQGIEIFGPYGLFNRLTKNVLEIALEAEMHEYLGDGKHDVPGRGFVDPVQYSRCPSVQLSARSARYATVGPRPRNADRNPAVGPQPPAARFPQPACGRLSLFPHDPAGILSPSREIFPDAF
jgi:hypothetical protein